MTPNHKYWLGLHLIPQFGIARISSLLSHFATVEELWRASDASVSRLDLPARLLEGFLASRRKIDLEKEMDRVEQVGARLVTIADEEYPTGLRSLDDRPLLLYVCGQLPRDGGKAIAIVGTRKPSKYGMDAAQKLSLELAQDGVTIVSGLAQGIDAAAHRGALKANGRTIAVMATGIDRIYPREHEDLARQIIERGAVITEMPIGAAPLGAHFPQRNRLISGLSLSVLVAEAGEKSGALNTAAHASMQGRDVFALPHNIYSQSGRGCNALIQDGAKLIMNVEDVLDELNLAHSNTRTRIETERAQPADDTEELILAQLGADPVHVDLIVRQTNLPTATVTGGLTLLELKGLAETSGPMQYCRARGA